MGQPQKPSAPRTMTFFFPSAIAIIVRSDGACAFDGERQGFEKEGRRYRIFLLFYEREARV